MRLFVLLALFISCSLAYDISEKDFMVRDDCTEGDSCDACGASTTYTEVISNDKRKITGSGCPHHYSYCTGKALSDDCGGYEEEGSVSEAVKQCFTYVIPAYPVLREDGDEYSVACEMGTIGIALNGVSFFSGAVDTDCTLVDVDDDTSEWISFDMCGGHSTGGGKYHYHFVPSCLVTDADAANPTGTGHSAQIGWALDGFPVYGPLYTGGVDASDYVDDCGGIEEELSDVDNFKYRYYITGPTSDLYSLPHTTPSDSQYPYTFACYAGYKYSELASGSTGDNGYTDDYTPEATDGYTTAFSSYGTSGNYVSSYLSDGECSD